MSKQIKYELIQDLDKFKQYMYGVTYSKGDEVIHKGHTFTSLFNKNKDNPFRSSKWILNN